MDELPYSIHAVTFNNVEHWCAAPHKKNTLTTLAWHVKDRQTAEQLAQKNTDKLKFEIGGPIRIILLIRLFRQKKNALI